MSAVQHLPTPAHVEAEQALLGALLLDPEIADEVFEELRPGDFYQDAHRRLCEAMVALHGQGARIDPIALQAELTKRGELDRVGGLDYIAELLDTVPTSANARHYVRLVRNRAMERRVAGAGTKLVELASTPHDDPEELVASAEKVVFDATARADFGAPSGMRDLIWRVAEFAEERHQDRRSLLGVGTGLEDLDAVTAGWQDGDFVVLAARPSQGKTALLLQCADAAARAEVPTLFLSLEMSKEQLAGRLLAKRSGVSSRRIQLGKLRDEEWPKLSHAVGELGRLPLYIDDKANRTMTGIRALTRRMVRARGIRLLVVDYLQLVVGARRAESRQEEVRGISQQLKGLARDLNIPVVVASQLSRAPEQRGETKPRLSDLRDSGGIEQDADVVALLWNNPKREPEIGYPPLTVIVAKQRNGPTDTLDLYYDRETGQFADWSGR